MFRDLARALVAVPRLDKDLCDAAWHGREKGALVSSSPGLISSCAPY